MKTLTSKGKHTVKVGNHPHRKLVGKLKGKSSKITQIHNKQLRDTQLDKKYDIKNSNHEGRRVYIYIYIYIYMDCQIKNLIVTTNQNSIIDTHKNEYKHNTKDSHQIMRTKEEKKKTCKNKFKTINKMANKNIHIDNYLKCKQTKCSNQKTQSG